MPASARLCRAFLVLATLAVAVATCLLASVRPSAARSGADLIESARSLEREGVPDQAERALRGAMAEDQELARDAAVLLELARITEASGDIPDLLDRAVARTRDARLLAEAHRLKGDYLFMEGQYLAASDEYALASRHASRSVPDVAALRRATSFLAAGDISRAAQAYGELASKGSAPGELTPWAELGLARATLLGGDATNAAARFEDVARTFADRDVRLDALVGLWESREAAGDLSGTRVAIEALTSEYPGTFEAVLAREKLRVLEVAGATPGLGPPDTTATSGARGE